MRDRPTLPSPPPPAEPAADAAFDVWLTRGLHEMFDGIAGEPIPPELLKLIQDDRARADIAPAAGGDGPAAPLATGNDGLEAPRGRAK